LIDTSSTLLNAYMSNIGYASILAPELFCLDTNGNRHPFTEKADVYSFGLLLWEMLTLQEISGSHLVNSRENQIKNVNNQLNYKVDPSIEFGLNKPMLSKIADGFRPVIPYDCPKDYSNLISICWSHNPNDRPTFKTILTILEGMEEFEYSTKKKKTNIPQTTTYIK